MRNRQTGVTLLGWVILLTPFAIVGYGGIRLAPIFLNYMKVAKAMDQTAKEMHGEISAIAVRNALDRHFEIDMVEYPATKDMKITRDEGNWVLECAYDDEAPFFGNVSLHVVFDKKVKLGGG
jgi:hypothetical protein